MKKSVYADHLADLELELAKLQETVKREGLKVVILFEGRDAAGKGGLIKTIMRRLSPRVWKVVALPKPSDRERTQWYFQRYVRHLPAAGEVTLFDRSWYNRAVVEPVMGFCTPEEHDVFMRDVTAFEKMLVDSGIILIKYWVHVSPEQQEKRFQDRATDPRKRWKLSPIDLEGRKRWVAFSKARDKMLDQTSTELCPWRVIDGDNKKKARLNCIRSILDIMPVKDYPEVFKPIALPARQRVEDMGYTERPLRDLNVVTDYYED
ncbi:MAG: polyphosphate kinase 2 [Pseudomonadota bacterium]